ncbi:MAG: RNA methyltransferase [Bacteroidetes bacterium]|nr:RNA methyltransferase [Bacteroidota bacterium]
MISKVQIKYIRSLHQKKYREEEGRFIAEGEKVVEELLQSNISVFQVYATQDWSIPVGVSAEIISSDELKQISLLQSPNKVLAVAKTPQTIFEPDLFPYHLFLDEIKDPGNLGTMIRTAEWFGLKNLFCSMESAELFNPKTVQASMGSIFRMNIHRMPFEKCVELLAPSAIYAASLAGEPLPNASILPKSLIIIGSESHGIQTQTLAHANHLIKIPKYGAAESLNAGIACGILLHEFSKALVTRS